MVLIARTGSSAEERRKRASSLAILVEEKKSSTAIILFDDHIKEWVLGILHQLTTPYYTTFSKALGQNQRDKNGIIGSSRRPKKNTGRRLTRLTAQLYITT